MVGRPPLELAVEITDASGSRYRWDSSGHPDDRPQGIGFGTKRGDGFAQGGCTLARRVDDERTDVRLKNEVAFVGADGSIAYEGRVAAVPRSYGTDGHSMAVSLAGWMSYAKQRKFDEIYVDRALSNWLTPSTARRAYVMATLSRRIDSSSPSIVEDSSGGPAVVLSLQDPWDAQIYAEAIYDAGESRVGSIYYDFIPYVINPAGGDWHWYVGNNSSDNLNGADENTGDLKAASGSGFFSPTTARRFGYLQLTYAAASAGAAKYELHFRKLAVHGDHTLTRQGDDPGGYYASDVIRDIASRFCPKLDTSGVQDTTHAIPHLVFNRAFPFDAFLEVNKYHLWDLGVWENRTLHYGPNDLTDYDWEIRLDDPGVTVEFQGDTTEDLFNGIVVTYTDVDTGKTEVLTPDDDSNLADTSVTNPANLWGEDQWDEATISIPTDAAGAAQIGRMLLAEKNSPKAPGVYRVTGHIKDRAGHWQQVWKVRAGDTIAITSSNSLSDRPHLIVETNYSHDDYTIQIAVDNTLPRVDAFMDRAMTALTAANLA